MKVISSLLIQSSSSSHRLMMVAAHRLWISLAPESWLLMGITLLLILTAGRSTSLLQSTTALNSVPHEGERDLGCCPGCHFLWFAGFCREIPNLTLFPRVWQQFFRSGYIQNSKSAVYCSCRNCNEFITLPMLTYSLLSSEGNHSVWVAWIPAWCFYGHHYITMSRGNIGMVTVKTSLWSHF